MSEAFDRLTGIMARLRGEGGCPWDREQTHETLKAYLVEETYETLEAIDHGDDAHLQEELGDLLLQVVFHAQIAGERSRFGIDDVITGICDKLVRRHPHVFGDETADTPGQVMRNWEKIKQGEKEGTRKSALDGVPRSMPALLRAKRLQSKAGAVGFDWDDADGAFGKMDEELAEFRAAFAEQDPDKVEEELGDLLFSLVNVSRFVKVNPEEALTRAIGKFIKRFEWIEKKVAESGREMGQVRLAELDAMWDEAKDSGP